MYKRTEEILWGMIQELNELADTAGRQGLEQAAYDLEHMAQDYLAILAEYRKEVLLYS